MWLNPPKDDGHFFFIFQVPMNDQSPLWLPTKNLLKINTAHYQITKTIKFKKFFTMDNSIPQILAQFIYSPPTQKADLNQDS
jgi:hypothetical protein